MHYRYQYIYSVIGKPAPIEKIKAFTDAAYADFVSRLQASGYTVQTPADLFGHAALGKSKSQDVPLDINIALEKGSKGKATYFKPTALPSLLMVPGDFLGSGMSSMGINMSAGQASMALTNYAREAGVGVVDVVYLIDFSQQKRPGAFSFGGLQVNSTEGPEKIANTASLIRDTAHDALDELKRIIGVLRGGNDPDAAGMVRSIAGIPDLVQAARRAAAAGVPVVRASRCLLGGVFGAPAGALPSYGALTPWQARIELMLDLLAR